METIQVSHHPAPARACPVHVGSGLGPRLVRALVTRSGGARLLLVSDDIVRPLHGEPLAAALRAAGLRVDVLEIRSGEAHKVRSTKESLEDRMIELGAGRDAVVLAVGGGVVGDLAGFVAATYHRGIPWIAVPTTLLAMVDASVGGKTGLDTPGGKNLIGAFHPPESVWADLEALSTLSPELLREGFAEVVKAAMLSERSWLASLALASGELLRREPEILAATVTAAIRRKASIVARDPHEQGERALLNFGHTVGHALEAASGYRLRHGAAVAIGMMVEADLSRRRAGLSDAALRSLAGALRAFDLPTRVPGELDPTAIWDHCRRDKKARSRTVRCILLREIGEPLREEGIWTCPVEREEMLGALERNRRP